MQNQKHIQIPDIFSTLVYSEFRYIQNTGIFRTLSHIYNETLIISTAMISFTNYNYFCKAFRVEINILR